MKIASCSLGSPPVIEWPARRTPPNVATRCGLSPAETTWTSTRRPTRASRVERASSKVTSPLIPPCRSTGVVAVPVAGRRSDLPVAEDDRDPIADRGAGPPEVASPVLDREDLVTVDAAVAVALAPAPALLGDREVEPGTARLGLRDPGGVLLGDGEVEAVSAFREQAGVGERLALAERHLG